MYFSKDTVTKWRDEIQLAFERMMEEYSVKGAKIHEDILGIFDGINRSAHAVSGDLVVQRREGSSQAYDRRVAATIGAAGGAAAGIAIASGITTATITTTAITATALSAGAIVGFGILTGGLGLLLGLMVADKLSQNRQSASPVYVQGKDFVDNAQALLALERFTENLKAVCDRTAKILVESIVEGVAGPLQEQIERQEELVKKMKSDCNLKEEGQRERREQLGEILLRIARMRENGHSRLARCLWSITEERHERRTMTTVETQFEREIRGIFQDARTREIMDAVSQSFVYAGKATFKSKKEAFQNSAKLVGQLIRATGNKVNSIASRVKNDGWKAAAVGELSDASRATVDFGRKVAENLSKFKELPAEVKREQLAWGLAATLAALGTAGGFDMEGGVPDLDIRVFGIGGHRSVLFHSILAGFGTEFLIRFSFGLCRRLKHHLPLEHSPLWDQFFVLSEKMESGAVAGSWFGIAVHLFRDASLFSQSTKPYSDLPFHMTMGGHQAALAGNATLAGALSLDDEAKKRVGMK